MSTALGNRQEDRSPIFSTFGNLPHVKPTPDNVYDILLLLLLLGQSIIAFPYVETQYQ